MKVMIGIAISIFTPILLFQALFCNPILPLYPKGFCTCLVEGLTKYMYKCNTENAKF